MADTCAENKSGTTRVSERSFYNDDDDPFRLHGRGPSYYSDIGLQEGFIRDPFFKVLSEDVIHHNSHLFKVRTKFGTFQRLDKFFLPVI